MKVAVTVFKENLSPRLDISDSWWIYEVEKKKRTAVLMEKCVIAFEHPVLLINFLKEKYIATVLCSGCPHFYIRMLSYHGFEVISGLSGDPAQLVNQWVSGDFDILRGSLSSISSSHGAHKHKFKHRQARRKSGCTGKAKKHE